MLEIPVYNSEGQRAGSVSVDPRLLGGKVRPKLLKQAIVMYQANLRQGTSATKSRSQVEGSTRKLYRQKGTGNARMGTVRTNVRRGGGVAFAKGDQNFELGMNKKMRRLARNNAILAKIQSAQAVVVDGLAFERPNTKRLAALLHALGAGEGCVLAVDRPQRGVFLSGRNIARTEIRSLCEATAYDILRRKALVMTRPAFDALMKDPTRAGAGSLADPVEV